MLRTELPFALKRWPQRLLGWLLGEVFLGFLAIIAAALTLFPMLFPISAGTDATLNGLQWLIIGWFGVEYAVALAAAPARGAFLRNPWRLLDLATILIPLASLLPSASSVLLSSPVLRLVRLVRIVTLGLRASGIVVREQTRTAGLTTPVGPAQVMRMTEQPAAAPAPAHWDDLLGWLRTRAEAWYHVANPSSTELAQIGVAAGLPAGFLENQLVGTSYPHLTATADCTVLFAWVPETDGSGRTDRHAVLFVAWGHRVLSLSRRTTRLIERRDAVIGQMPSGAATAGGFVVRVILGELARIVALNETLVASCELALHALEDIPVRESRPEFFERTFRLKKELSAAQSDLWRFKGLLADLAAQRARLPDTSPESAEEFGRLSARADYLYETIINIREEVLSVIELHLNVVSFDMNRVMRVLAVVSVLGLIPAVIGGLFGMNLVDNPWPFTLPQVAFSICFGMLLGLYLFFVKGWLR